MPKSEEEIKKRWHNLRSSALRYFKKHSSSDDQVKWAYWIEIIMCAPNRRPVAGNAITSSRHGATCRRDMSPNVSRPVMVILRSNRASANKEGTLR